eukprot:gene50147-61364_t
MKKPLPAKPSIIASQSFWDVEPEPQATGRDLHVDLVATGGAGSLQDIKAAVKEAGASAVAIGSMAVFQGKDLGVLIKFPARKDQDALFE